jgi:predicted lipid-binding transport protein (Tim44 family)
MGSDWIEVLIFAGLAAFVAWKLLAVLGTRTGHEPTAQPDRDGFGPPPPVAMPSPGAAAPQTRAAPLALPAEWPEALKAGVSAVADADPAFDPDAFIGGARKAYGMILTAFWSGDTAALRPLLADDVLADFARAIESRGGPDGRRLIAIDEARISDASVDSGMADVTVHFTTRVEDGSGTQVSRESWTFSRHLRSPDPTWLLIATDSD